ncbi:ABC transporter permease [Sciscionella marina]|uniref:ABC transporter permease n=1 Tax=Sciscionella marina TaxID=508770 RepID=UPI000378CF29|nr:ABC transporter permease [Sciscionella marina]
MATTAARAGAIPVTPTLLISIGVLLLIATGVVAFGRYASWRAVLTAGVRAVAQLLVVSLLITQIVRVEALTGLFVFVMFAIAARTSGRRITADHTWWRAGLSIAAGVGPVVAVILASGAVPMTGLVLIPLVGQLIGGALTATSIAGRRLLDELEQRHGEVEAALSLGLTDTEARLEIARPVASAALSPALDQTRTVGTVTLPGAFVGMLLGGATPIQAGAVQLFVLIGLLAVEAIAIQTTLIIVARGHLTRTVTTTSRPVLWLLHNRRIPKEKPTDDNK